MKYIMQRHKLLQLTTTNNMAFNTTEQEIIKAGVAAGKTRPEVEQALTNYRTGVIPTPKVEEKPGYLSRVGSELGNAFSGLQQTTERGAELTNEGKPVQGAVMSGLGAAAGFIRGAFSPVTAAIAPTIQKVIEDSGITDNAKVQEIMQNVDKWAKENPDLAKNTQNLVEIASTFIGVKGVTSTVPVIKRSAEKVIDKGTEILGGISKTGREGIAEATSKALDPANIMQRVARLSKGKQAGFEQLTGESVGSYLVNRKIFGDIDQISTKLYDRFITSKGNADKALAKLRGNYKNSAVGSALRALLEKEVKTSSPGAVSRDLERVKALNKKHMGSGLNMSEINDVKRLYERNVKTDYLRENLPDKVKEATNIDSAIRQWQATQASQLGLKDLRALNKETQAAKQLLDDIGVEYAGSAGNNAITLTDWIILAGGNPAAIGGFIAKKALSSKGVMSKVAEKLSENTVKKELPRGEIGESTIDNYLKFLKSTEGQTMQQSPPPLQMQVPKGNPSPDSTTPIPKAQGVATPDTATAQTLRGTKGLTADDIMKTYPNIKLTKDVPATDVYGNKKVIPEGEKLTPYELKGNKILLQDGQTYLVSKNQFQNIKGQSVGGEAKPFAPELDGLEETVRGGRNLEDQIDLLLGDESGQGMTRAEARQSLLMDAESEVATKFEQYQLPGGGNYREILIKAPSKGETVAYEIKPTTDGKYLVTNPRYPENISDPLTLPKAEELKAQLNAENAKTKEVTSDYISSHYPDDPNLLAHLRMNDHTYNGKKVAFMEELQSDWGKDIRAGSTKATHPFVEKGKWIEPTVKRALQDAVDSKADYFSWINGEQTSARYNLATQVDKVSWKNQVSNPSERSITIVGKDNKTIHFPINEKGIITEAPTGQADWKGKKLDEVLGKGLADKIMAEDKGSLSGEGLKFGGEWANNLYDKQVKDIVQKLTGGKVETIDMKLPITDKKAQNFRVQTGTGDGTLLTPESMKVGQEIKDWSYSVASKGRYEITKILDDGKFEAVPKGVYDTYKKMAEGQGDGYLENRLRDVTETFDISNKTTTQQAIKLTPEIKARIQGKALKIETSGKLTE